MTKNIIKISGNIVDVVQKNIFKGEIIIKNGKIIDIIKKDNVNEGYILPGLINSHVHIESSMLTPCEFAKIAVKHGTVATVSDPHEIANVLGVAGVDFMIENSKKTPFKFFFGAPSCVPATEFETSGSRLDSKEIEELLKRDDVHFLSEVLNYPGVINNDEDLLKKIEIAKKYNKKIDGHAPLLNGEELMIYAKAGISTDHECINIEEAIEKIKHGIKIQIREGSAAKNFQALYKLIDEYPDSVMLCTDDSHPTDLIDGHINLIVKNAINKKLDIFNILRAVTYNPVKHYNIPVGLLQKNDNADLIVIDNLKDFNILKTYINGVLVYENDKSLIVAENNIEINNFSCNPIEKQSISVKSNSLKNIKVIEVLDGELFTNKIIFKPKIKNNEIVSDIENDILKIVVVNRYKNEPTKVGFIKNFGLKHGAIAESISHDSHNIIAVGVDDENIVKAINKIIENKGGIIYCNDKEEYILKLEIAGLMSKDDVYTVAEQYKLIEEKAKENGILLKAPFMTLSFMSLLVIPQIKIGDKGLFDVNKFQITSVYNE